MINDEELGKGMMTLNAIWIAMLVTLAIYLFVGLQVPVKLKVSMDADTFAILRLVLYLFALVTLISTRFVWNRALSAKGGYRQAARNSNFPARHPAVQKYATAMIVALAMSESIGIYGLLLFFMGKNTTDLYLLILVSAVAMCMYRPKREEIANLSKDDPETTPGGAA